MKQFYFSILFISFSLFISAQTNPTGSIREAGITDGDLSVTLSGGASYSVPIAVPPGINGVVPEINLNYNSQGGNGSAGYGWALSGLSSISRIPATKFHDGTIDGVDFDALDRFALDGQRLVVKNGTSGVYGGNETTYETEIFSNIKITSHGIHPSGVNFGPAYFLVEYPDGSKAYYGNSTDSRSITEWSITYWENAQGIRISYLYNQANNLLEIAAIKYGTLTTTTPINQVQFIYEPRVKSENYYIGGQNIIRSNRLKEIKSSGNNIGFRNYVLDYNMAQSSEKYDRLYSITEKSGDNTKSYNPTVFNYNNTDDSINYNSNPTVLSVNSVNSTNAVTVNGDFDGDGNMDFILYPKTGVEAKSIYWIFTGITPNTGTQTILNLGLLQEPGAFDEILPVSWLSWNNKLMNGQGWTVVKTNPTTNLTTFKTYAVGPSSINPQGEKSYTFPKFSYYSEHPLSCTSTRPPFFYTVNIPKRYLNGDFNGDGLTDIAVVEENLEYSYLAPCDSNNEPLHTTSNYSGDTYFMNLDRRLNSNFVNNAGKLIVLETSKTYVADFNGDGKSDIYVFDTGKVRVYSLNDNKQFILLYQTPTTDTSIQLSRPILIGDFNGDGKSDFMIPIESGNGWYRYLSTGTTFAKENRNIAYITPNDSFNSYNYIATDYDNDGKSDLTIIKNSKDNSTGLGTIQITAITEMTPSSFNTRTAITTAQANINQYALPIFIPSTDQQRPRFEIAFINNNRLHFFYSKKDSSKDRLLTNITTGNGVQQAITYHPLEQIHKSTFYTVYNPSQGTESYPYFDIVASPDLQIVSKLEKKSATVSKMKFYGYYGAVTNLEGLGFMGFRSIMETNWHNSSNPEMCTITKRDIKLRGAITESYLVPYLTYPNNGFNQSGYTTKTTLSYTPSPELALQSNKVFKLQNSSIKQIDTRYNTSAETTISYNENNNPLITTTVTSEGAAVAQTVKETVEYESPNPDTPYIIDRPYQKTLTTSIPGENTWHAEIYEYDNNHLVSAVEKYATGTGSIVESNLYDSFGNLTQKTVSAQDMDPRITKYQYDTSGRFLTKIIDNDNLESTFEYYLNNGLLKKQTDPYGLSSSYTYDSWFRKLTAKDDQLNKVITYNYTNTYASTNGSETTVTITTDALDGSASEEKFDDLGRKTRSGAKDINGTYSYVSYLYDIYDRSYKISEPYFGTTPSQWNETKFDIYSRPTESISFNNRTTTIAYPNLSTTITDGQKSKTIVKNAIGNIVSTNETTGGNINFSYFTNGNLKQTSYNGINITMEQDGWGRKTKLIDPSAGTFTYKSNELGELTEETSQNGGVITTITRDNSGRPTKKTIVGGGTDSETKYTYDATKLPITITYVDNNEPIGANKTITTITYDPVFKRALSVEENKIGVSKFIKSFTYDGLGRVETETKRAEIGGKFSTIVTKNIYKNGNLYQILDINNKVLWQTNMLNAKGQVLESVTGNGIKMTNTYDIDGYLSKMQHDKTTVPASNILTLTTTFNKNTDNLDSRINSSFGNFTETFKHDEINRLTEFTNKFGAQQSQTYDASGKILGNNLGFYQYDATNKYQNTEISLNNELTGYYNNRGGIYNDDMESRTGWSLNPHNSQCISFDFSKGRTGKSIKFNTSLASDGTSYVQSDVSVPIDNIADTEYTFSGWVYTDNPNAQLTLFQYNANETGYFTYVNSVNTTVLNNWKFIEKTVLVPASVKSLRLRLDAIGIGNVWFDDVKIRKTIDPVPSAFKKLNVTYNAFKSPKEIEEIGVEKISFTYNDENQRSTMYYGDFNDEKLLRQLRKHYSADGTMEVKENRTTGAFEFVTYIGGDGYSAPIAVKSDGITQKYLYLHRDYQGSILAITDSNGAVIEKRLFDAWGSIMKVQDGAGNTLIGLTVLDRGYTGHEHIQSVGLINMNARLYDPILHRFLQVDNYIQDPTSTQNYNQYGYVFNNPLQFTDPSGNTANGPGKDCVDCGLSNGQQTWIGNGIKTLKDNWDSWGIKDWAKQNINFKKWGVTDWTRKNLNLKNWGNSIKSFFGGGKSDAPPPPPNMSQYVNLNNSNSAVLDFRAANNVPNNQPLLTQYNEHAQPVFEYDFTGLLITGLGTSISWTQNKMFNSKTWYSIKQMKVYSQVFNGNGATGGKVASALRISDRFKWLGRSVGAYNAWSNFDAYSNGKIGGFTLATEQTSNVISTFAPGLYGAAWGIGWEAGRSITKIDSYQDWKQSTWLPYRKEKLGY